MRNPLTNVVNVEGTAEGVDEAVDVLPESNPSDPSSLTPSGLPDAPGNAPWIVRDEPIAGRQLSENRIETNTERPGSIANSNFMPVTDYIYYDELCMYYREMDLLDPEWKTYRRYRFAVVVRNDALAEYVEDMGPRDDYVGGPVNIIGGGGADIVETFATMKGIADEWRAKRMPMPHQKYGMKAFESKKDVPGIIDIQGRRFN